MAHSVGYTEVPGEALSLEDKPGIRLQAMDDSSTPSAIPTLGTTYIPDLIFRSACMHCWCQQQPRNPVSLTKLSHWSHSKKDCFLHCPCLLCPDKTIQETIIYTGKEFHVSKLETEKNLFKSCHSFLNKLTIANDQCNSIF